MTQEPSALSGVRVLLIDRPSHDRAAHAAALEGRGCEVTLADDTHLAFQRLVDGEGYSIIVIAVDAHTGAADGFLRLVVSYLRLTSVPVVAVLDEGAFAPPLPQVRAVVDRKVAPHALTSVVERAVDETRAAR